MNENKDLRVLSDGVIIKRLLSYMKGRHIVTVIIALILMVVAVLFDVTLPEIVMGIITELGKETIDFSFVLLSVIAYGVLIILKYGNPSALIILSSTPL